MTVDADASEGAGAPLRPAPASRATDRSEDLREASEGPRGPAPRNKVRSTQSQDGQLDREDIEAGSRARLVEQHGRWYAWIGPEPEANPQPPSRESVETVSESASQTFPPGHHLDAHPLCEMFPLMSDADLIELSDDINVNKLRDPIRLFEGKILDGRNRYTALLLNDAEIPYRVFHGTEAEAEAYVISRNVRRRHLSQSQKRDTIARLLKQDPAQSNVAVAKTVGVDDKTVAAQREKLESTSEIPRLETHRGRDGKARKAPRKKGSAPNRKPQDASKPASRPAAAPFRVPDPPLAHEPAEHWGVTARFSIDNPQKLARQIIAKLDRTDVEKLRDALTEHLAAMGPHSGAIN